MGFPGWINSAEVNDFHQEQMENGARACMLAVYASWSVSQRFRGPVPFSPPVVWFATNDDCPAGFGHPELVVLASGLAPSLLIDLRKYSAFGAYRPAVFANGK